MLRTIVIVGSLLMPTAALADQKAADACGAKLTGDARIIYVKVKPTVTPGVDLRELMTPQVKALATAGTIVQATARDNAMAAGKCLQSLK